METAETPPTRPAAGPASGPHTGADDRPDDDAPPRLSPLGFWISLGLCLAIFVALNPFWEPLDMDQVNDNILWSYAPIPLLVAGFLALERKLGWLPFMLESIKLTFVKFAITFIAAQILWGFTGPPPRPATEVAPHAGAAPATGTATGAATADADAPAGKDDFFVREPPPPTPLDPAGLGTLTGTVTDAAGAPVAGARVWISAGLGAWVFAPPATAFVVRNLSGWTADGTVIQAHQLVRLHADAEQLHTAQLQDAEGRPLFNYPLAPGSVRELMFKRALGELSLACKVHGADEPTLDLLVVDNPFHTRTDGAGRFRLAGVPAGALQLSARAPPTPPTPSDPAHPPPADDAGPTRTPVTVSAGAEASMAIRLR